VERGVEVFAGLMLTAMGLSHILAAEAWKEFFTVLHSKGIAGSYFNAMMSATMGAFIVAFHPGFDGIAPSLLTIYGWLLFAKGALYLLVPSLGLKSIETPTKKDAKLFALPGAFMAALGIVLLVHPLLHAAA
jgi:hypothetical protein